MILNKIGVNLAQKMMSAFCFLFKDCGESVCVHPTTQNGTSDLKIEGLKTASTLKVAQRSQKNKNLKGESSQI